MAPPDLPGLPSGKRLSPSEIRERTRSSPVIEADPDVLSDEATVRAFVPGIRVPWVFVMCLVTGIVSIVCTYMSTHSAPVDCMSKGEGNALDKKIGDVARDLANLTNTVNSNADREHNDLEILKSALYKK